MVNCNIKVNLKYLSNATRELLGFNTNTITIKDRDKLISLLVDIMVKATKEKEAIISFTNDEKTIGSEYKSVKQLTKENLSDEITIEALSELLKEQLENGTTNFNLYIKNLNDTTSDKLMEVSEKYLDKGYIDVEELGNKTPKNFKPSEKINRLKRLKAIYFQLAMTNKINKSQEVSKRLRDIERLFEQQAQILFFPRYVSTPFTDSAKTSIFFTTNDIKRFKPDSELKHDKVGDEVDQEINNMLIQTAIDNLAETPDGLDFNNAPFVGISVKVGSSYHLFRVIKKQATEEGTSELITIPFKISESKDLYIPDIDYKVNGNRDFSKQWENEMSMFTLITPRVNKGGDNLYNTTTDNLEIVLSTDTSTLPNIMMGEILSQVGDTIKAFSEENKLDFQNSVFSKPVFLKGRVEALKEGVQEWRYTEKGWVLEKNKPVSVVTKGLTEDLALPVFSDNIHVGSLDTLSYFKLGVDSEGLVTSSKVDVLNMTEDQLKNFVYENFSVDINFINEFIGDLEINTLDDNTPKNISIIELIKYHDTLINTDQQSKRKNIEEVVNNIIDNLRLKKEIYNKAKKFADLGIKKITFDQLEVNTQNRVAAKFSEDIDEVLPNKDLKDFILDDKGRIKNNKLRIIDDTVSATVFKAYFREKPKTNYENIEYYVLVKPTVNGQVQENYLVPSSKFDNISEEDVEKLETLDKFIYNNIVKHRNELITKSNQSVKEISNKSPKLIVIEKGAYVEVGLGHKKIVEESADIAQKLLLDQYLDWNTLAGDYLDFAYNLDKVFKSEGFKIPTGNNRINTRIIVNGEEKSFETHIRTLLQNNKFNILFDQDELNKNVLKVKKTDKSNFGTYLDFLQELSVLMYLNFEQNLKIKDEKSKHQINTATLEDTILKNLKSPDRLHKVLSKLNLVEKVTLFNVHTQINGKTTYIPINSVISVGKNNNQNAFYGFRFLGENTFIDDMLAFLQPADEVILDINQALVNGFEAKLEYMYFNGEEFKFKDEKSKLSKAIKDHVDLKSRINQELNEDEVNNPVVFKQREDYQKSVEKIKEVYRSTLSERTLPFTFSYNTKKEDWNNLDLIGSKLETNLNEDFPIFKTIKYSRKSSPVFDVQETKVEERVDYDKIVKLEPITMNKSLSNLNAEQLFEFYEKAEQLGEINRVWNNTDDNIKETYRKHPNHKSEEYDNLEDEGEDFKFEEETLENDVLISQKEIQKYLNKVAPYISIVDLESLRDLIERSNIKGNPIGVSVGHLIALRENYKGVLRHEVFHNVFNNLFTKDEQSFYLSEVKSRVDYTEDDVINHAKTRNIQDYKEAEKSYLEEKLADLYAVQDLEQPTTLLDRLGQWLKGLLRKISDFVGLTKQDKLLKLFKDIDKGKFANRNPKQSKYIKFKVYTNQLGEMVAPSELEGSQKYLFYSLLHSKVDIGNNRKELVQNISTFLETYLNPNITKTKEDYKLPKDYVTLKKILFSNGKIDKEKLEDYYIPFVKDLYSSFEKDEDFEDDLNLEGEILNEDTDRAHGLASYNQDPTKIGGDLKKLIAQTYTVANDEIVPEFIYLDVDNFIRKLQKIFSTVPIDPERQVLSFWENLQELSQFDNELNLFYKNLDRIYKEGDKGSRVFKSDVSLLNKLVSKIVLEQQYFSKGIVSRNLYGKTTEPFGEFKVVDAFHDMHEKDILNTLKDKNNFENAQFFVAYTIGSKAKTREFFIVEKKAEEGKTVYYSVPKEKESLDTKDVAVRLNNIKILKTQSSIEHLKTLYHQKDSTGNNDKHSTYQKAAIISAAHSLVGVNVDMYYGHLFSETYKNDMSKQWSAFLDNTTLKNPNSELIKDAFRYGTSLKIQIIKDDSGKSVYALAKSNALKVFKQKYQDRIKRDENGNIVSRQLLPTNNVAISFSHTENRSADFTDLDLAQHIQFSIGQFKNGFINIGQLEGNKTNFFVKVGRTDYKNDSLFHSELIGQYVRNIQTIKDNIETIQSELDEDGLIKEDKLKELTKKYHDSIIAIKWKKVGDKLKPEFTGKGYRLYFNQDLKLDNTLIEDLVKQAVNKETIEEKLKTLSNLVDKLQSKPKSLTNSIDDLVSESVQEVINILQDNVRKKETTNRAEKVDYNKPEYKEFLKNYVRTYLIESDKLYTQIFGSNYYEAFKNANDDFTKRMKSLAIYGANIHKHKVQMYEDEIFWIVKKPGLSSVQGNYVTLTNEEFEKQYPNVKELEEQGYKFSKVEATDGQAYNSFFHKYFIQLDKGRSYDLTKAYFTYLNTDKRLIWKDGKSEVVLSKPTNQEIEFFKNKRLELLQELKESELTDLEFNNLLDKTYIKPLIEKLNTEFNVTAEIKQELSELENSNVSKYLEQQKYIKKVEQDAIKNKYKNGIFKGATLQNTGVRSYYLKNSEATLERSMYMTLKKGATTTITYSDKVQTFISEGKSDTKNKIYSLDYLWNEITKEINEIERIKTSDSKDVNGTTEYVDARGYKSTKKLQERIENLKRLYGAIYQLYEPIKGQEKIFNLYRNLETNGFDVAAYQSGSKINKIDGVLGIDFGSKMDQTEMPNDKNLVVYGTQLKKILQDDIDPNVVVNVSGKSMTIAEVKKKYSEIAEFIVKYGVAEIESQLFPNGVLDKEVFGQLLSQFVSTTRNATYFEKFFETEVDSSTGVIDFIGVPDEAAIGNIFFQTISKIINEPTKFKLNGEAYQLISTAAYTVMRDSNGKNIPLEFRNQVQGDFIFEPLQALLEEYNGHVREIHETIIPATEQWQREYLEDRKEAWGNSEKMRKLEEKYPQELFYMISNRIPTENKRSIGILKIVDFFIPETGSVIVSSAALQSHAGADHDGDKLFTMRYNAVKILVNGEERWVKVGDEKYSEYFGQEFKDAKIKKHLVNKSLFSDIIQDNKTEKLSLDNLRKELEKRGVVQTREELENQFLDYSIALQSNKYTLESELQHEATDISKEPFSNKAEQQYQLSKVSKLYRATGSPLKQEYDVIEATKVKGGVGISANMKVILQIAEQMGFMVSQEAKKKYTFGRNFLNDFSFNLVGTIRNNELVKEIDNLSQEFADKFNEHLDLNFPNHSPKIRETVTPLGLMSTRNAIFITVNTDAIKERFPFGINLHDYTLALYQIGAALNIPTNILLHIGTHPLIRELTNVPVKQVKEDVKNRLGVLAKELKDTDFNVSEKVGSFSPATYDLNLDDLFKYGVGFEDIQYSEKENEVLVYFDESVDYVKGKYKQGETLNIRDLSELYKVFKAAENNPNKTYFVESYKGGTTYEQAKRAVKANIGNNTIPFNIIFKKGYKPYLNDKEKESSIAEFKILSFVNEMYSFSQDLSQIGVVANIDKGSFSINKMFQFFNVIRQPISNFNPESFQNMKSLANTMGIVLPYTNLSSENSVAIETEKEDDFDTRDEDELENNKPENTNTPQLEENTSLVPKEDLNLENSPVDKSLEILVDDSWGKYEGFDLESAKKLNVPKLANLGKRFYAYLGGYPLAKSYFSLYELVAKILPETALLSYEGKQLLINFNNDFSNEEIVPTVSFAKYGAIQKGSFELNEILKKFERFYGHSYYYTTNNINLIPKTTSKKNNNISDVVNLIKQVLITKFPENKFAILLKSKGNEDNENNLGLYGIPIIDNRSQSLDFLKELIMNDLTDLLKSDLPFELDNLVEYKQNDEELIEVNDLSIEGVTIKDAVRLLLEFDSFLRLNSWDNESLLSFSLPFAKTDYYESIKDYEATKTKEVGEAMVNLTDYLIESKMWQIQPRYIFENDAGKVLVKSLALDKLKDDKGELLDEERTIVPIKSFEATGKEKDMGKYVRINNAVYKRYSVPKQTKEGIKDINIYVNIQSSGKSDNAKYLTTYEKHLFQQKAKVVDIEEGLRYFPRFKELYDLSNDELLDVDQLIEFSEYEGDITIIENALLPPKTSILVTNNSFVVIYPEGYDLPIRSFNQVKLNEFQNVIKLGKSNLFKINLNEVLANPTSSIVEKLKFDLELVNNDLDENDNPIPSTNPNYNIAVFDKLYTEQKPYFYSEGGSQDFIEDLFGENTTHDVLTTILFKKDLEYQEDLKLYNNAINSLNNSSNTDNSFQTKLLKNLFTVKYGENSLPLEEANTAIGLPESTQKKLTESQVVSVEKTC